jgi:hypothetical protein
MTPNKMATQPMKNIPSIEARLICHIHQQRQQAANLNKTTKAPRVTKISSLFHTQSSTKYRSEPFIIQQSSLMTLSKPSVGIIGAGIGGLTTAHALLRRGFTKVKVFDQADKFYATAGAGFGLGPNGRVCRL